MDLTVAEIRECVRQLRSAEIKPTGNPPVFLFRTICQGACCNDDAFIEKYFRSWLKYV